jgi:hypothetical protein
VLSEVAQYPNAFKALGPLDERIETGRFTLCMGPVSTHNPVRRQSFSADEVDDVLAAGRSLLRARGRLSAQWELGSAAQPLELVDLLLARGVVPDTDPFAAALVLTSEPPPPAPHAVAHSVETLEEYTAAKEVQIQAFKSPPGGVAEDRGQRASPAMPPVPLCSCAGHPRQASDRPALRAARRDRSILRRPNPGRLGPTPPAELSGRS